MRWIVAMALVPGAALAQVAIGLDNYPETPKAEPLSKKVFGVAIDDPYRWME